MKKRIKVLYVGGLNRSGSTLLTKCYNEIEGFFSVNEIVFIGLHGLHNDFILGNGQRFSENALWQEIFTRAFGQIPDWKELSFFENGLHKAMRLPANYVLSLKKDEEKLAKYREKIAKLYRAITEVTQCSVIVDSSKSPDYAYLLSQIDDIDLYLLHLTRDFRGIYHSHQKKVQRKDLDVSGTKYSQMQRSSLAKFLTSAYLTSIKFFLLKHKNVKYQHLRYEDFCADPPAFLQKTLDFVGIDAPSLVMDEQRHIMLKEDNLGIWGNPMRMEKDIRISTDQQWRKRLPLQSKVTITSLLYPLLKLYGY